MSVPTDVLEKFTKLQNEFSAKQILPRVELFDSVEESRESIHGPNLVCIYSILRTGSDIGNNPYRLCYFVHKDRLKPGMKATLHNDVHFINNASFYYYLDPNSIEEVIKNTQPKKIEVMPEESTEKYYRSSLFPQKYQRQVTGNPLETKRTLEFDADAAADAALQRDIERALQESLKESQKRHTAGASASIGSSSANTENSSDRKTSLEAKNSAESQKIKDKASPSGLGRDSSGIGFRNPNLGFSPLSAHDEEEQLRRAMEESLKDSFNNTPREVNLEPMDAKQRAEKQAQKHKESPLKDKEIPSALHLEPTDQKHRAEKQTQKDKEIPSSLGVSFNSINTAYQTQTLNKFEEEVRNHPFFNETLTPESPEKFKRLILSLSDEHKGPFQSQTKQSFEPWQQAPYYLRPANHKDYEGLYVLGFLFYEFDPESVPPRFDLDATEIVFKPTEQGYQMYNGNAPSDVHYNSLEDMVSVEHEDCAFDLPENGLHRASFYNLDNLKLTVEEYCANLKAFKGPTSRKR